MFVSLSHLSGLTELKLTDVVFDHISLDNAHLQSLPNVRSLTLNRITRATRKTVFDIVSNSFPKLEKLSLSFGLSVNHFNILQYILRY